MKRKVVYRNAHTGCTFIVVGDDKVQARIARFACWVAG